MFLRFLLNHVSRSLSVRGLFTRNTYDGSGSSNFNIVELAPQRINERGGGALESNTVVIDDVISSSI